MNKVSLLRPKWPRKFIQCSKASNWSSSKVRSTFLDYFSNEHQHEIVPSSSVIPPKWRNVSPLPFVNAGMVRWRPLFMNELQAPKRFANGVANSQKCIRVGGKNCDLESVGYDGHHLTCFEMLGNWSFNGSYDREKSIQMAWKLLTDIYQLPKNRLFVTYFNGCDQLGLKADMETKEIWSSLGLNPGMSLLLHIKMIFSQRNYIKP